MGEDIETAANLRDLLLGKLRCIFHGGRFSGKVHILLLINYIATSIKQPFNTFYSYLLFYLSFPLNIVFPISVAIIVGLYLMEEVESYDLVLLVKELKLSVKFPCRLTLQHAGRPVSP